MRFRQGPLTEASIIYLVCSVLSFLTLIVVFGFDFGTLTGAFTVEAMIWLLPGWFLWAITGLLTKRKSILVRFFTQTTVSSAVAAVGLVIIKNAVDSAIANGAKVGPETNLNLMYLLCATFYLGAIVGSIFTNFYVVRRIQAGESAATKQAKKGGKNNARSHCDRPRRP